MKNLFTGLLLLGSLSSFANDGDKKCFNEIGYNRLTGESIYGSIIEIKDDHVISLKINNIQLIKSEASVEKNKFGIVFQVDPEASLQISGVTSGLVEGFFSNSGNLILKNENGVELISHLNKCL